MQFGGKNLIIILSHLCLFVTKMCLAVVDDVLPFGVLSSHFACAYG